MPLRRHPAPRRCRLTLEHLEIREVLSGYPPTTEEQIFLERLNDARANPAAYGQSIGLDLSTVAPSQPLAFNTDLIQAARAHSQDMNNRRFFAHVNPSGVGPGERLTAVGFAWRGYGESLVAGPADPAEALRLLIVDAGVTDLGHRRHLLAMDDFFRNHNQVGVGSVLNGSGPYRNYFTIDSGVTGDPRSFLTGVVMNDSNANGRYDEGEGLGGVTLSVTGVGNFTTFASGGYSIALNPGTYTVTVSGGGLSTPITRTVTLGSSNVRQNFTPTTPSTPPTPIPDTTNYESAISRLYQTALGRTAVAWEIAFWLPAMQQPGGPTNVARAIVGSHEARTRLVKGWYTTYLGREASGAEEQGWVQALLAGYSEEHALAGILGSDEYFNRAGSLQGTVATDATFVRQLFRTFLGRSPGDAEIAGFTSNFVTSYGRGVSSLVVLHSFEYRAAQITSYYLDILGRSSAPGQAEINAWVNSGLDLLSIRLGFYGSGEFLNRR